MKAIPVNLVCSEVSAGVYTYTVPEHFPCHFTSLSLSPWRSSMTLSGNPTSGSSVRRFFLADPLPDCSCSTTCSTHERTKGTIREVIRDGPMDISMDGCGVHGSKRKRRACASIFLSVCLSVSNCTFLTQMSRFFCRNLEEYSAVVGTNYLALLLGDVGANPRHHPVRSRS